MDQRRYLQMVRTNQFERVYGRWKERKVTQQEAAAQPEMSERTFRRYIVRYSEEGVGGLLDKRLDRISPRRAPREAVEAVVREIQDEIDKLEAEAITSSTKLREKRVCKA